MCRDVMRKQIYTESKKEEGEEDVKRERVEQMLHLVVSPLFPLWPGIMEG